MKPNEIFALAIRVIGVLGIIYVTRHLVNNSITEFHQLDTVYFVKKIVFLLIGLYFVLGAPLLVKVAYSGGPKTPADKQGQ